MTKPRVHPFESFGIVPAAGHSRRMGQPKLKMPWGGLTVIEQVVAAWRRGGVDHVMAVVRADDAELARMCDQAGAIVVSPTNLFASQDGAPAREALLSGARTLGLAALHLLAFAALVLAPAHLVATGRLVRPLEQSLQTEFGYYFICRENLREDPIILQLQKWLSQSFASVATGA